jgi:hypothetical protein
MRSSGRFKTWKKSGKLPPTNEVCGRVTQERVPKFVQVYSRPFSHAARSPRAQKWARRSSHTAALSSCKFRVRFCSDFFLMAVN